MKKTIIIAMLVIACATVSQAAKYGWGTSNLSGSWFTVSDGDLVQLVWASGGTIGGNNNAAAWALNGSDKIAASTTTSGGEATVAPATINPGDSFAGVTTASSSPYTTFNNIYCVVYNASTAGAATKAEVATASFVFTANTSGLTQSKTFSAWQNVTMAPEPSTIGLVLFGVGAIALRRRFSKKA